MTPSEIFLDHYNGLRRVKQIGNLQSLFFFILFFSSIHSLSAFSCIHNRSPVSQKNTRSSLSMVIDSRQNKNNQINRKQKWMNQSFKQLSISVQEAELKALGHPHVFKSNKSNMITTKGLQIAQHKLRSGYLSKPEIIYSAIIDDLLNLKEKEEILHTTLAVSTILLAWLLQRMGEIKEARKTFLRFFRIAGMEKRNLEGCVVSAKVLEAFTHSEVKQGQSYEVVHSTISGWMKTEPAIANA